MNKDVVIRLRMTQEDADDLNKKVKLTGLTKSSFIRVLIKGYIYSMNGMQRIQVRKYAMFLEIKVWQAYLLPVKCRMVISKILMIKINGW